MFEKEARPLTGENLRQSEQLTERGSRTPSSPSVSLLRPAGTNSAVPRPSHAEAVVVRDNSGSFLSCRPSIASLGLGGSGRNEVDECNFCCSAAGRKAIRHGETGYPGGCLGIILTFLQAAPAPRIPARRRVGQGWVGWGTGGLTRPEKTIAIGSRRVVLPL